MSRQLHEIVPCLYLANFASAEQLSDPDALVVNCTKNMPMVRGDGLRLAVDDDGSAEATHAMAMALPYVVRRIHEAVCAGGRQVVVHCLAGQQRSPAVVAAYLMRHRSMTPQQAVEHVRGCKPDAFFCSVNFWAALEQFRVFCSSM